MIIQHLTAPWSFQVQAKEKELADAKAKATVCKPPTPHLMLA